MKKRMVEIKDDFWSPRIEQMCEYVIPYQYQVLNDEIEGIPMSHAIENFRIAAGLSDSEYHGMLFQDSDVGKWIEAAAYSLRIRYDPEIARKIDGLVEILKKAQQPDGYLNSYYICAKPDERLTNIAHGHEMYCAGHLLEAAAAYAEISGKTEFLEIMERYMDYFIERIGPEPGKRHIYPGHPELELALYKLYRFTGKEKYLNFMEYLLLERGKQPSFLLDDPGFGERYHDRWFSLEYHQAHLPVLEQTEAKGHAVRAMYLYAGLADLAYEKKDKKIIALLQKLWDDVTRKKMYVTGAVGSDEHGEALSVPYDLPNDRAYGETCASIGMVFWASRMLNLNLNSIYADVMELALYNGVLSGSSSDGKRYFYVNPLMSIPAQAESRYDLRHVSTSRVGWFGCACCPPNIARMTASLDKYVCTYDPGKNDLAVHLYVGGKIILGENSRLDAEGEYVSRGRMKFTYHGCSREITVRMRIPRWSRRTNMKINCKPYAYKTDLGYASVVRRWNDGDEVEMIFDNSPRFIYADPRVSADAGRVAVKKGPVVYCLEETDNGSDLNALVVEAFSSRDMWEKQQTCDGCRADNQDSAAGDNAVYLSGYREFPAEADGELYSDSEPAEEKKIMRAVPYFMWGNREKGEMLVWMRKKS